MVVAPRVSGSTAGTLAGGSAGGCPSRRVKIHTPRNTGEVVVGNIGSEKRASYGAVGTPINAAYRIESFTVGGQILISPTTHERVQSDLTIIGTKDVKFKGLDQPVCLYDVGGIGEPYQVFLPEKKEAPLKRLDSPVPIECFLLEGKTVSDTAISGHITHLGDNMAHGSLGEKVVAYANLRIELTDQNFAGSTELYAKVLPQDDSDTGAKDQRIRLQFTSMAQEARNYLEQLRSDG